jgi:AcrR family transcriptional regulator
MKSFFINAGYDILLNEDLDNLTVRNIAKKAGYSYATIYNYFKDNNELMWSIGFKAVLEIADHLSKYYKANKNEKKGDELLKSTYKKYISYFLENKNVYQFIFFKQFNDISLDEKNSPPVLFNLQQEMMEKCVDEGFLKLKDINLVGDLLTNSINGVLSLYFSGKENITEKDLYIKVDRYIDFLLKKEGENKND